MAKTNCYLVRCYILLQMSSPDYQLALNTADFALEMAQARNLWQQEAKAQRLRGHCFKGMGRWREAYNCYVRSASALDGVDNVGDLTRECLEMLEQSCDKGKGKKRLELLPHEQGIKPQGNKEHARRDHESTEQEQARELEPLPRPKLTTVKG